MNRLLFSEKQNRIEEKSIGKCAHHFFLLHEYFLRVILGGANRAGNNIIVGRF